MYLSLNGGVRDEQFFDFDIDYKRGLWKRDVSGGIKTDTAGHDECAGSFCGSNDLRYYLARGTLLGAIRHKGCVF